MQQRRPSVGAESEGDTRMPRGNDRVYRGGSTAARTHFTCSASPARTSGGSVVAVCTSLLPPSPRREPGRRERPAPAPNGFHWWCAASKVAQGESTLFFAPAPSLLSPSHCVFIYFFAFARKKQTTFTTAEELPAAEEAPPPTPPAGPAGSEKVEAVAADVAAAAEEKNSGSDSDTGSGKGGDGTGEGAEGPQSAAAEGGEGLEHREKVGVSNRSWEMSSWKCPTVEPAQTSGAALSRSPGWQAPLLASLVSPPSALADFGGVGLCFLRCP